MDCTPGLKKYIDVLKDIRQYILFLLFFLSIVLLLIAFQALICYQIVPVDITFGRIILDVNAPTLSGMLLCHYAHDPYDPEHLRSNALFLYRIMALIFVTGYVILPANKWDPPKHFLRNVFLMFFLLLPFPLSGLAIIQGRMNGMAGCVGFSGIESALVGLSAFLCVMCIFTCLYPRWKKRPESFGLLPIAGATVICLLLVVGIIMFTGGRNVDTVGHLIGCFYGLLVPFAVSLFMESQSQRIKNSVAGFLVVMLVVPSVAWIAL
jgi:hypothetical protein